jgi:hypothetical protein
MLEKLETEIGLLFEILYYSEERLQYMLEVYGGYSPPLWQRLVTELEIELAKRRFLLDVELALIEK